MNNIYYVYQYLRNDGTPYYIGKGKGRRAYVKQRVISLPIDKTLIKIIAQHLSEYEAFLLESKLIQYFGRKDLGTGILHNKTDGGEGTRRPYKKIAWNKGKTQTPEHNAKISQSLTEYKRTAEHQEKLNNAFRKNPTARGRFWWNNGTIEKMSKTLPGQDFVAGRLPKNQ